MSTISIRSAFLSSAAAATATAVFFEASRRSVVGSVGAAGAGGASDVRFDDVPFFFFAAPLAAAPSSRADAVAPRFVVDARFFGSALALLLLPLAAAVLVRL